MKGNYNNSHNAALFQAKQTNKYNLYFNNCVENCLALIDYTDASF